MQTSPHGLSSGAFATIGRAHCRNRYNGSMSGPHPQARLTFLGAAQFVTGSMHLLEADGRRILLDCGIVLGRSAAVAERNRRFPFDPATIDAVLVSHAHVDHCGNLPNLVAQGFRGPIYCTPATRDLMAIMLSDSARIQEEQAELERIVGQSDECTTGSLYSGHEVQLALERCVAEPYDRTFSLGPGITARFSDAGHLLGSAVTQITIAGGGREHTLTYTGDLGRPALHFLRPPSPLPASDVVVSESTYGGRTHQSVEELARKLKEVVARTVERGGKVLVPAFNLGRSQLVVHYIQHWIRQGALPEVPLYMDSPLAADITEIHRLYPELLAERFRHEVANPLACYIRDARESRELGKRRGPCILVASGGMCEAGRIVNHLEHNVDDPRCTIVLVSYQAPGSLGRKLMDKGPHVHFRGRRWNKWAEVVDLNGFSGHADQNDLRTFFAPLRDPHPHVCLVHGEPDQANALAGVLRRDGLPDVTIPQRGDSVALEREHAPSVS